MLLAYTNILTHIMVQKGTKSNVHRFQVWDNVKNQSEYNSDKHFDISNIMCCNVGSSCIYYNKQCRYSEDQGVMKTTRTVEI